MLKVTFDWQYPKLFATEASTAVIVGIMIYAKIHSFQNSPFRASILSYLLEPLHNLNNLMVK